MARKRHLAGRRRGRVVAVVEHGALLAYGVDGGRVQLGMQPAGRVQGGAGDHAVLREATVDRAEHGGVARLTSKVARNGAFPTVVATAT